MKTWIKENLMIDGKLVAKRCKEEWFGRNLSQFIERYQIIIGQTSFLTNPTFPQRIWHIMHDRYQPVKCSNPLCDKSPKFLTLTRGYLKACCNRCAQLDPITSQKIKTTNLKRYGSEYGLSNKVVIGKRKQTLLKNYGVDNPTKSSEILKRISDSNKKNFGVKWILSDQKKKEKAIFKKYGVKNVQQWPEIRQQTIQTRRRLFFDSLTTTNRLQELATPLFSSEEYLAHGLYEKYKFSCNKCHTEFLDCLEDGDLPRCPKCFKGRSFFETEVLEFVKGLLESSDIILENDKTLLNTNQEIDIYLPTKKIAIECDGLYWHGEIGGNKNKNYHLDKTISCEKQGIRLIHIFEDEWLSKKGIVKSKLTNLFKKSEDRLAARKCTVKEVEAIQCNTFLEQYHIQGKDKSSIRLGLFEEEQLVGVMTFGILRTALGSKKTNKMFELYRFASAKSIIGGASKLLSHFIKQYNPSKIVSYADRRWSMGNLYEKLGFKKINDGTPNYWYFGRGNSYKRHHRFGYAKHTLVKRLDNYNPVFTEWRNMQNHGWDRIWDCGSFRYEMTL
jgi:hypothetical protein